MFSQRTILNKYCDFFSFPCQEKLVQCKSSTIPEFYSFTAFREHPEISAHTDRISLFKFTIVIPSPFKFYSFPPILRCVGQITTIFMYF